MNSMQSVVDQLTADLAEGRRIENRRRMAYLALARTIVSHAQPEPAIPPVFERQPVAIGRTALAA